MEERFSPGAVRLVELHNFQVCSQATYRFVPTMNLICGPNGTGKSTAIVALFVIFFGKIADISKESYLDFIKMGTDQARIKVVLQGQSADATEEVEMIISKGEDNFHRPNAHKSYRLNGSQVSAETIKELVETYNIQVNNLCQFLPQERVAAFSGQTAAERLRSTEAAVGSSKMLDVHDRLANQNTHLLQAKEQTEHLKTTVEELEKRVQELTDRLASVEELHQHEQQLKRLENLEKIILYFESNKQDRTLDQEIRSLEEALQKVESEGLLVERLASAQQQVAGSKRTRDEAALDFEAESERASRALDNAARLRDRLKAAHRQLVASQQEESAYNANLQQAKEDVAVAQREVRHKERRLDPPEQVAEWQADMETTLAAQRTAEEAVDNATGRMRLSDQELHRLDSQKRMLERRAADAESVHASRYKKLAQRVGNGYPLVRDGAKLVSAVELVRAHADLFEHPVLEPAVLTVTITRPDVAQMLLTAAKDSQMHRFVCQSERDFNTLNNLANKHHMPVSATHDTSSEPLDSLRRFSAQQLLDFGFDGLLIDVCEGPEPVLRYLAKTGLARTPYSLGAVSEDQRQLLSQANFTGDYVDRNNITSIMRSRYGRRQIVSTSRQLRNLPYLARFMESGRGNVEEAVERARSELVALETRAAATRDRREGLKTDLEAARARYTELDEHRIALAAKTATASQALRAFEAAKRRADDAAADLDALRAQKDLFRRKHDELYAEQMRLANQMQGVDLADALAKETAKTMAQLALLAGQSDEQQLGAQIGIEKQTLQATLADRKTQKAANERNRAAYKDGYMQVRHTVGKRELRELEAEAKQTEDVLAVQREMRQLKAQVELNDRGFNYDEIRSRLEAAQASLETNRTDYAAAQAEFDSNFGAVNALQQDWERDLERIVGSIDARFSELMGCLDCRGNVMLLKDELFQNWGIDILVSFREGQAPQRLARAVQSGGERAVCTAMYLLALQGMSTAPFRVLDEINQGMDERNERATHKYLMETACAPGASAQYILITPKLLMGLSYGAGMQAATPLNGPSVRPSVHSVAGTLDAVRALRR